MPEDKKSGVKSILWIIVVLLIIAIGQNYYYWANINNKIPSKNITSKKSLDSEKIEKKDSKVTKSDTAKTTNIEVIFISDKRCKKPECQLAPIIEQLKKINALKYVKINELDYSDAEAKTILEKNNIKKLPVWLFSSNEIDEQLNKYLTKTDWWYYSLELWASFDPTAERSEKGYLILDKKVLAEIKENSYLKGNKDAKITWLEYSDLECPFCAKLHNSGTPEELVKKYWDNLNKYFQSFPLGFHKNAIPWAGALECIAKEKWSKAYYDLKHISFKEKKSDKDFLIKEAIKLWANKETITKCINDNTYIAKINKQQETGTKEFGITGTPWNVLINNETGEYEVISGAYPTSAFVEIIDKLLK